MKNIKALGSAFPWALAAFALSLFSLASLPASGAPIPGLKEAVVVVDKKTNKIHVANYVEGPFEILKTYRVTFGKSNGDKLWEGDLKTPEGIYDFLYRKVPTQKKFGPLAIYIGYPNSMDKHGKKTGDQILLHGTDDPSRLERPFDSLGCVVTDNENVAEISECVKIKETKIIITRDYELLKNAPRLAKAKDFFSAWLKAWSEKDLVGYIESYADEYVPQAAGRNRNEFARYKENLNKTYDTIKVTATDVRYYFHEKYDLITFTQHYESTFPNGKPAYSGSAKKNLYIQERNDHYRIVTEEQQK